MTSSRACSNSGSEGRFVIMIFGGKMREGKGENLKKGRSIYTCFSVIADRIDLNSSSCGSDGFEIGADKEWSILTIEQLFLSELSSRSIPL